MDHPLYTISYVADIENVLVIMINRITPPSPADPSQGEEGIGVKGRESVEARVEGKGEEEVGECGKEGGGGGVERTERDKDVGQDSVGEEVEEGDNGMHVGPIPRMICHVLETKDVSAVHVQCTVYLCMYMYMYILLPHLCQVFVFTQMHVKQCYETRWILSSVSKEAAISDDATHSFTRAY